MRTSLYLLLSFCFLHLHVIGQHDSCSTVNIAALSFSSSDIATKITNGTGKVIRMNGSYTTWSQTGFDPENQSAVEYYFVVEGNYKALDRLELIDNGSTSISGTSSNPKHFIAVEETGTDTFEILNPDLCNGSSTVLLHSMKLQYTDHWIFSGITFQEGSSNEWRIDADYNIMDNCSVENFTGLCLRLIDSDSCTIQNSYFRNIVDASQGLTFDPCDMRDENVGVIISAHDSGYTNTAGWNYPTDGNSEGNKIINNHFYDLMDGIALYYNHEDYTEDSTTIPYGGDMPNTLICGNEIYIEKTLNINYDRAFSFSENAMDFKNGSLDSLAPVIVEYNTMWGFREVLKDTNCTSAQTADPGSALVVHLRARNIEFRKNKVLDSEAGVILKGSPLIEPLRNISVYENEFRDIRASRHPLTNDYWFSGHIITLNPWVKVADIYNNVAYDCDNPIAKNSNCDLGASSYTINVDSNDFYNLANYDIDGFAFTNYDTYWEMDYQCTTTSVTDGTVTNDSLNYCYFFEQNDFGCTEVKLTQSDTAAPYMHHVFYSSKFDSCALTPSASFDNEYLDAPYVPTILYVLPDSYGGDTLEIELNDSKFFGGTSIVKEGSNNAHFYFKDLSYGTTYYARVRNLSDCSCWSTDTFRFQTYDKPVSYLSTPADGSTGISVTAVLYTNALDSGVTKNIWDISCTGCSRTEQVVVVNSGNLRAIQGGNSSYQDTITSSTFELDSGVTYTVKVTAFTDDLESDCKPVYSFTTVSSGARPTATGINETLSRAFSVSPNPSSGAFTLSLDNSKEKDFTLQVFNARGQLVYEKQHVTGNTHVFGADFQQGLYYIQGQSGEQFHRTKIIKQ